MRTAVRLLAVILLLPMLWACGKDEEFDYGDFLTEFVTYEGQEEGYACFTFRSRDDAPVQTLLGAVELPDGVEPGARLVLRYTVLQELEPGKKLIRVDGCSTIILMSLGLTANAAGQPSDEITVESLWRSGDYINLSGWVPYSGQKFGLALLADKEKAGEETVDLYMVYDLLEHKPMFERRIYASFDISSLWQRESCRRVIVHVGEEEFVFEKK